MTDYKKLIEDIIEETKKEEYFLLREYADLKVLEKAVEEADEKKIKHETRLLSRFEKRLERRRKRSIENIDKLIKETPYYQDELEKLKNNIDILANNLILFLARGGKIKKEIDNKEINVEKLKLSLNNVERNIKAWIVLQKQIIEICENILKKIIFEI